MSIPDYTGRTLDNKYLLKSLLGEGGMGFVYLGEHVLIGRPVAVKFLHSIFATNREVVRRFYREARAAAAIGHKNIIDVLDVGATAEGEPYLVMEFLEGEALAEFLDRKLRVDLNSACGILEPALTALGAAHEKKIIHRDLKPDNIFLSVQANASLEIKLIDFGISKFQTLPDQTQLTQDGSALGTPAYMSPEQARGASDVDHLTDIYAMGIIFYEMLTGEKPFVGQQYNELLYNVLTTDPRPPSEVYAAFPEIAWPVIERAIQKEASDRYQSAEAMLQAVRDLCSVDDRTDGLETLSRELSTSGVAAGSLGASSDTDLSFNWATEMMPTPKPRLSIPPVADIAKSIYLNAKHKLLVHPRRRKYQIVASCSVAALLILTLVGVCSSGGDEDSVLITVKNVPHKSKIFYDDSLVPMNPFRVKKGKTIVPLRVEGPRNKEYKISIVPLEDQTVDVRAQANKPTSEKVPAKAPPPKKQVPPKTPERAEVPKRADAEVPPKKADKKPAGKKERASGKRTKSGSKKEKQKKGSKKKKRNPFKKVANDIKRAFKGN